MLRSVKVPKEFEPIFERAQAFVEKYFAERQEDPSKGTIEILGNRYILVRSASMSIEFFELIQDLYRDQGEQEAVAVARGLLFDIAHSIGVADARSFHRRLDLKDPIEKLSAGPIHFAYAGWAYVDIHPDSRPMPNKEFVLVYDHPYSFEADSWMVADKHPDFPVCVMNAGYSSGWCEESFGIHLVASEILCRAKGDEHCRFVMAHPDVIEEKIGAYLDTKPTIATQVGRYEIPGFFERKRHEEALRRERDFTSAILDTIGALVVVLDSEGRVVRWNRSCEAKTGFRIEELRNGAIWERLVPPDERAIVREVFAQLLEEKTPSHFENDWLTKDDGRLRISWSNTVLLDESGEVEFIIGTGIDITERARLQARLTVAERMASIGLLAAGVGHEINNPLCYVLANLELLKNDLPRVRRALGHCQRALEEAEAWQPGADLRGELHERLKACSDLELEELVADALEGAARVRDIVRDLKTFSRGEEEERTQVRVEEALRTALGMAGNEIRHRAELVVDYGRTPRVMASPGRLAQVFLNLLVNGAQAIDEGDAANNEIGVRTYVEGDQVVVEITDTGCGIPSRHWPRLFDPFFTTKTRGHGSGLGLSISHNIVTSYGGQLEFTSEVGKGSRFSVRLPVPVEPATGAAPAESPAPAAPRGRRGRVLIADDEPGIGAVFRRALGTEHEVHYVASGADAIELLGRDDDFDVVFCDLMMPDVTGMDLHAWIEQHRPTLIPKMVFITGGTFTPRAQDFVRACLNTCLEKPLEMSQISAITREMVGHPGGGTR